MQHYIEDTKEDRDVEKQERADIQNFLDAEEVQEVFSKHNRLLFHMFKFYAAQDTQKDKLSYDSELLSSTLSYREFVRWSYQ